MLKYERLTKKPGAFRAMTGMSVEEFEALLAQVKPRYEAALKRRRERAGRRRSPGGGLKSRHGVRERLLMTMVWLRLYLTVEAVGVLFELDKSTVSRFTRPVLLILRDLGMDTLGWPEEAQALAEPGEEPPGASGSATGEGSAKAEGGLELPGTFCSDHLAIIDATEQPVERSRNYALQKAHYSGKRRTHTRKTQITVNEHGRIRHISASAPGSTHDLTLLRVSGVPAELPLGVTGVADCGYRGMQNDFPHHSIALPYRPRSGQPLLPEEKYHNHFVSRLRVVVENAIAELKHFRILSDVFRHAPSCYDAIICAIAGIVNRRADRRSAPTPLAIPAA